MNSLPLDELQVLVVEDQPGDAALIEHLLARSESDRVCCQRVACLTEACERMQERTFGVVLLDLGLPDAEGLEGIRAVREVDASVPIVVLSGADDAALARAAVEAGAYAFLMKSWVLNLGAGAELLARTLLYAIESQQRQVRLEALNAELAVANKRLAEEAREDALTTLPNRRGLEDALERLTRVSARAGRPPLAALIDCDDFKRVNETFGHAAGDLVLSRIADAMRGSVRPDDVVARVGGDEFVIVLPATGIDDGVRVANRVRRSVADLHLVIDGHELALSVSVGLAALELDRLGIEEILERTRGALSRSKRGGKNRVGISSAGDDPDSSVRALERILSGDDPLHVTCQPLMRLSDREIVGHEMFVRGVGPSASAPRTLFHLAEAEGLADALDLVSLRACVAAALDAEGLGRVHLNVRPRTLASHGAEEVLEVVAPLVARAGACLELPVALLAAEIPGLLLACEGLREAGVQLAIDDVGNGRSVIEPLVALDPHFIKLDRRAVHESSASGTRRRRLAVLRTLTARLGAVAIAEGIESSLEVESVLSLGVEYGQGFYLARPSSVRPSPG